MAQLYYRPPEMTSSHPYSPRRILLITTGGISNEVKIEIDKLNSKLPIPIEAFTGTDFAMLLNEHGLTSDEVKKSIDPRIIPQRQPKVVKLGSLTQDYVIIERMGAKKSEKVRLVSIKKGQQRR
jgi:hypothetical protein